MKQHFVKMSEGKKEILLGDCLELMKDIPDKSIDMILCDLPYGTTACKWDTVIPFNRHIKEINNLGKEIILYRDEYILQEVKKGKSYNEIANYFDNNAIDGLWDNYNRIIKDNGVIVLFGQEPFSSNLRSSNFKLYRYDWIWEKDNHTNFLNIKKQPAKRHELISVFYKKQPTYNPQMWEGKENHSVGNQIGKMVEREYLGGKFALKETRKSNLKYPISILRFKGEGRGKAVHPTQKPVALFEYLIKTYTNEGELVLDNAAGSGTTAIACLKTKRQFIVIEKEQEYYDIILKRVADFNKNF